MAQIFAVNVYAINYNAPLKTPQFQGFNPTNVKFRPASSGTVSASGQILYGIVEELPRGLNVDSVQFAVVETVAQLVALANA